jgi:hypothetical protein
MADILGERASVHADFAPEFRVVFEDDDAVVGMVAKPISPISLLTMRGMPKESQVFQGSFEVALNGSGIFIFSFACPSGVIGGMRFFNCGSPGPRHVALRSRAGAGPRFPRLVWTAGSDPGAPGLAQTPPKRPMRA